jgi:hypothetical protein
MSNSNFEKGINVEATVNFIKEVDGSNGKFLSSTIVVDGEYIQATIGPKAEAIFTKLQGNLINGDSVKVKALIKSPVQSEYQNKDGETVVSLKSRVRYVNNVVLTRAGTNNSEMVYGEDRAVAVGF